MGSGSTSPPTWFLTRSEHTFPVPDRPSDKTERCSSMLLRPSNYRIAQPVVPAASSHVCDRHRKSLDALPSAAVRGCWTRIDRCSAINPHFPEAVSPPSGSDSRSK